MQLTLIVTSHQSEHLGEGGAHVFDERGGIIGRDRSADWQIEDPTKGISGRHARIHFVQGQFCIEDTSTNGTAIGRPDQVIAKATLSPLRDGDQLYLGDFEILVQVIGTPLTASPESQHYLDPNFHAPAHDPHYLEHVPNPYEGAIPAPGLQQPVPAPVIPRGPAMDWPRAGQAPTAPAPAPISGYPVHGAPAGPGIQNPYAPAGSAPMPNPAYGGSGQRAPYPAPPGAIPMGTRGDGQGLDALYSALGLDARQLAPDTAAQIGAILRIVIQGLVEVLQARAEVRDQFRINATILRRTEYNPLKVAHDLPSAMQMQFLARNPAFLDPVEAFTEALKDLRNHELAVLAGMQAAFHAVIERFEPEKIEQNLKSAGRSGGLFDGGKGKAWDYYCEMYALMAREPDMAFTQIFAPAFIRAYEDQIQRLGAMAPARP